jgi:3-phenylpropionate/cinnamic acid dioxygenase small subunit
VLDEFLIRQTLARFCLLLDDGRFDDLVAWFTDDATLVVRGSAIVGKDAIRDWFTASNPPHKRGKHLTTNIVVEVVADRAGGEADFLFLNFVDGQLKPAFVGRYTDQLVKIDGRWLFSSRTIAILAPTDGDE